MNLSNRVCRYAFLVLLLAAPAAQAAAEDPAGGMSAEEQAMMKKWEEFKTPGAAHAHMQGQAGSWATFARMWMAPGQPPTESQGESKLEMILGGRYLVEHNNGSFMGQPFSGMGMTAYDNLKKKYVATWADNMGTGIMVLEGTCDASGDVCTFSGEAPDVMTGGYKKIKMITRHLGPDKHAMEMYDKAPDGKEWKNFEMTYTRK